MVPCDPRPAGLGARAPAGPDIAGETLRQVQSARRRREHLLPTGNSEVTTGCQRQVTGSRRFAQGHDAVLKSLLIRAGIANVYVNRLEKSYDPTSAATQFGFASQVIAGVAAGRARAEAAAARQQTRQPSREVKVGRWWYPVSETPVGPVYQTKTGATRSLPADGQTRRL